MKGVNLYVGTTGTGKTYAALEDLRGLPFARKVVMDLGGSATLCSLPKVDSLQALPGLARFTPATPEEYEAALERCYQKGNVAILIDDAAALKAPNLSKLCRLWRPRNLRMLLTTQHISGDVAQAVMACDPCIFAFRTTSPRSLEWLQKWHQVEPEEMRDLEMGDALELSF